MFEVFLHHFAHGSQKRPDAFRNISKAGFVEYLKKC